MKTKQEQKEEAHEEYIKIRNKATIEYNIIYTPVFKEYSEKINPAKKIYDNTLDNAWSVYVDKCAEIDKQVYKQVEKVKIIDGRKYKLIEE